MRQAAFVEKFRGDVYRRLDVHGRINFRQYVKRSNFSNIVYLAKFNPFHQTVVLSESLTPHK